MTAEECISEIFPGAFSGKFKSTSEDVMFVTCPGEGSHDRKYPRRDTDTAVRYTLIDKPVHVHCFHESCWPERASMNAVLQAAFKKHGIPQGVGKKMSPKEREDRAAVDNLAGHILKIRESIFKDYRDESFLEKRLNLPDSREKFFSIFPPRSVIWAGREWESGPTWGGGHFRTVEDWAYRLANGDTHPFTSTCVYPPDAYSRTQFIEQLYRVIEFDKLSPEPLENQLRSWALFQYLAGKYALQLALAVHTGNKSPHFWVADEERFKSGVFEMLLKRLGADTSCWRPGQPVRLPGVLRTDKAVTNQPQCVIAV